MGDLIEGHVYEVIRRLHKPPGKTHSLWMYFAKCECGEMSPWQLEGQYADMWGDKHLLAVKHGVLHPTKSFSTPRVDTVYRQYRILQEDERYDQKDRDLFKVMADELEGRTKPDEVDPDQMELF